MFFLFFINFLYYKQCPPPLIILVLIFRSWHPKVTGGMISLIWSLRGCLVDFNIFLVSGFLTRGKKFETKEINFVAA